MRGRFLAIFLFLILSFSLVSSIDISVKDEVKLGENFVVKVSGSFYIQPKTSDIKFYREGIKTSFGVVKLEKIEGDYYFFLEVPLEKVPGNYSIVLEDVEYNSGRNVVTGDIQSNFTVLNEMAPFSISPPLLITSEDYSVEVENLMDSKITISLEKNSKSMESIDSSGDTVESGGFLDVLFGLFSSSPDSANETDASSESPVESPTSESTITLSSGERKTIYETAPEKKGFQMLELYYNGEAYGVMVYSPEGKPIINVVEDDDKEKEEELVKNESSDAKLEAEKTLAEKGINESDVTITEDGTVVNKTTNKEIDLNLKTCSELAGKICNVGEKCNGKEELSIGGECCIGTCEVIQKSSTGKVIGWFIIAAIAIFLTWFFKQKYKKAGPGKIDIVEQSKPKDLRI